MMSARFKITNSRNPGDFDNLFPCVSSCPLSSRAFGPRKRMKIGQSYGTIEVVREGKIETTMETSRLFLCLIWSVRGLSA
jgi:hypothetical protein